MNSSSFFVLLLLVCSSFQGISIQAMSRFLEDGAYMEDDQGNRYATYSLSWRYLGLFIDCDMGDRRGRRKLEDQACTRKVMWAAYYDPEYQGFSIGEYQFFDWTKNVWDDSTCHTENCHPMDCHLPDTRYQLLGIFTETDGLSDWAEQLFKHQGYCLWDGDKEQQQQDGDEEDGDYQFMQNQRETWSRDCEQGEITDRNGNSLYIGVKPLPYAQMTFGVYSDEACIVEVDMTIRDYMLKYYTEEKDYSSAEAQYYLSTYLSGIKRWNALMHDYRTCQPCRAYNKVVVDYNNNRRRRSLNDGNGDNEMWGYDCYDDAGYTNCNQCYKFGSQTDMAAATLDDLRRATSQGSIMEITVDGVSYGGAGAKFEPFRWSNPQVIFLMVCLILIVMVFLYVSRRLLYNRLVRMCQRVIRMFAFSENLNEKLDPEDDTATDVAASDAASTADSVSDETSMERMENTLRERDAEISHLAFRLDMERTQFSLERQRLLEQLERLQNQQENHNE